jgi:DNA-binding SARP family transcriptional activator
MSGGGPKPLDIRVFGTLQVSAGGRMVELGPEQEQRMLVALLDAKGAPVTHGRLMNAIWDDPPDGALDALYHLVRKLRRRLEAAGYPGVLTGRNGTYRLSLPPEYVDAHRFHALAARARQLGEGDDQKAVDLLEEALSLQRGEPLAGLRGRWVDNYRHKLVEERRAAELALFEAAIRHGQSRERLPGLHALYRDRPADEWVAWLLMHALYRAGRPAEALDVRREVAQHLDDTIATATCRALDDLYGRILRQDAALYQPEALRFPATEAGPRARALGRPGPRAFHDSQDQEENAMNAARGNGLGDAANRTTQGARTAETYPLADVRPLPSNWAGAAEGEEGAESAKDPQRGDQGEAVARPATSIVINGTVHAGPGAVFGTQNNDGTQNFHGGRDERA